MDNVNKSAEFEQVEEEFDLDFGRLWKEIKNKWKALLIMMLCFCILGTAAAGILNDVSYESTASFLIKPQPEETVEENDGTGLNKLVNYCVMTLQSDSTRSEILKRVGDDSYTLSNIEDYLKVIGDTNDMVTVTVRTDTADDTEKILDVVYNMMLESEDAIVNKDNFCVIRKPSSPEKIDSYDMKKYAVMGAALGFILSIFVIAVHTVVDKRLRNKREAERYLKTPVLATVPKKAKNNRTSGKSDKMAVEEYYNEALIKIKYDTSSDERKVISVTASSEGEGVSETACNIARSAAVKDKKILLIDCNFNKPSLAERFNLPDGRGISDLMCGISGVEAERTAENELSGELYVMTAGSRTADSGNFIQKENLPDVLEKLRNTYDLTVIDCASLDVSADAIAVSHYADGTVFVVSADKTDRRVSKQALNELKRGGADIAGCVMNKVDEFEI